MKVSRRIRIAARKAAWFVALIVLFFLWTSPPGRVANDFAFDHGGRAIASAHDAIHSVAGDVGVVLTLVALGSLPVVAYAFFGVRRQRRIARGARGAGDGCP